MAIDLISWAPELYAATALLAILFYSTGPTAAANTEFWCMVNLGQNQNLYKKNLSNFDVTSSKTNPSEGPGAIVCHLIIWAAVWCFLAGVLVWNTPFHTLMAGGVFIRDSFNVGACAFLLFFAFFAILVSANWSESAKIVHPEYVLLILLTLLGNMLLCYAADLTALYLCLELQSFAVAVLCSLNYNSAYAVEAGMKYFLLSAFSSCLLLLGVGLLYWDAGTCQIPHLVELYTTLSPNISYNCLLGVWLVSLGLLWKLAAAPMHFWAADVYMGAWTSISLLISTVPKIAVLCFWTHYWHVLWITLFNNSLFWFSAGSLLIGAIAPFAQVQIKRLLAFSSVGHMGFMLMCLVGGSEAYASLAIYLFLYCVTSLVTWGLLLWPYNRASHTVAKNGGPQYLWDLSGLNTALPTAAFAWTVGMLSLAGLPPAAGFLGKLSLFWATLNSHQYALVLLALLSTLLSSVYYLKVVKVAYVDNPKGNSVYLSYSAITAYVVSLSVLVLVLGLWYSSPFVLLAHLHALSA